jgi:NAD(P)-dependent dehydrogenase (short-subunit alcohol dehydrogenase family)
MADEKKDGRVKISGRQVLDFDLLDEQTKQAVIKCIQEKGRISVVMNDLGIAPDNGAAGFRQLID